MCHHADITAHPHPEAGTMADEIPGVKEGLAAQRAVALIAPNAANVNVENANTSDARHFEITNFRAEYADGSTVYAPRIVVDLG